MEPVTQKSPDTKYSASISAPSSFLERDTRYREDNGIFLMYQKFGILMSH